MKKLYPLSKVVTVEGDTVRIRGLWIEACGSKRPLAAYGSMHALVSSYTTY